MNLKKILIQAVEKIKMELQHRLIEKLENKMRQYAKGLECEMVANIRDEIAKIKKQVFIT